MVLTRLNSTLLCRISQCECSTLDNQLLTFTKFPVRQSFLTASHCIYRQILETPANKPAITSAEEISLISVIKWPRHLFFFSVLCDCYDAFNSHSIEKIKIYLNVKLGLRLLAPQEERFLHNGVR